MTAPLTPPECDLRDFAFMPLDVVRLRDSDIAATPDAEVFRAAVLAWCVAWHQIPAASLPDDDAAIARLIGMGRDIKGWKKLRASGALRGFVRCTDGRLYHEVVAEKAVKSWEAKQAQRDRTEKARQARLLQNQKSSAKQSVESSTNHSKGEVRESEDTSSLRSDVAPAAPSISEATASKPRKRKETAPKIEYPDWWPREKWAAFQDMRRSVRAKLTPEAERLLILKLTAYRDEGHDILAIINQSIENSYKGLFPVKRNGTDNGKRSNPHENFALGAYLATDDAA